MKSKVSGFLKEGLASEIQQAFLAPGINRSFDVIMPLISEINKAHLVMLSECGILQPGVISSLLKTISDIDEEGVGAIELDPAREEHYFNYEAEIIARLGSDVGGRMHVARSRNDLKSTQDRMRARMLTIRIITGTLSLRKTLIARAQDYFTVVMPGYTHMQPAQPSTYGWFLLGVESALRRDTARLLGAYGRINLCPLGAGAIAGTSFPISRKRTSELLGFDGPEQHAQDAIACRDGIMELLMGVTLLTTTVARMAQDFYYMTTYEFGTIMLPDSIATTSSIMPQKKNMGPLENLKARPAIMSGALMTALSAHRGVPFSHTQEVSVDAMRWVWEALEEADLSLPAACVIVAAAEPNRERMLELVQDNFSTVTELADTLVRVSDLPFREAHHVVGRVVRLAQNKGLKAQEITNELLADAAEQSIGRRVELSLDEVQRALDPKAVVEARKGSGGPSSADCKDICEQAQAQLEQDEAAMDERASHVQNSKRKLDDAVAALIKQPAGCYA